MQRAKKRKYGEKHHRARLSDTDVRHILELRHLHGHRYAFIAEWFPTVTQRTVEALCRFERRSSL